MVWWSGGVGGLRRAPARPLNNLHRPREQRHFCCAEIKVGDYPVGTRHSPAPALRAAHPGRHTSPCQRQHQQTHRDRQPASSLASGAPSTRSSRKCGPSTSTGPARNRAAMRAAHRASPRATCEGARQMQLARAAIVIEAEGGVAGLLHLDQREARADGVDRAGGEVEEVARACAVMPGEQVLRSCHPARQRRSRPRSPRARSRSRAAHRARRQAPASTPPSPPRPAGPAASEGWTCTESLSAGEQVLDQHLRHFGRRLEPDLADPLACRARGRARAGDRGPRPSRPCGSASRRTAITGASAPGSLPTALRALAGGDEHLAVRKR
jgi:hypothetical protein